MIVNVSKTEQENLLLLIKKDNGIDISTDEVDISNPTVVTDPLPFNRNTPNEGFNPNTQVTITAKSTSPNYVESATVKYRRIILEEEWYQLHGTTNLKYTKETLPTVTEENVKNLVTSLYPFITSSVNISASVTGKNATVTLTAKENSLVYLGTLSISITPAETRIDLSEAITKTTLTGFEYHTKVDISNMTIPGFIYG